MLYYIHFFLYFVVVFTDNCRRRFFYTQRDNYDGKARLSWREKYVCNFCFLLKKLIDGRRILVLSQKASSNLNLWVKGSDHSVSV